MIEGRRQALSATHLDTLGAIMELAVVMVLRDKQDEAVQLLQVGARGGRRGGAGAAE